VNAPVCVADRRRILTSDANNFDVSRRDIKIKPDVCPLWGCHEDVSPCPIIFLHLSYELLEFLIVVLQLGAQIDLLRCGFNLFRLFLERSLQRTITRSSLLTRVGSWNFRQRRLWLDFSSRGLNRDWRAECLSKSVDYHEFEEIKVYKVNTNDYQKR